MNYGHAFSYDGYPELHKQLHNPLQRYNQISLQNSVSFEKPSSDKRSIILQPGSDLSLAMESLKGYQTIYLLPGEYIVSKPVHLKEGQTLKGLIPKEKLPETEEQYESVFEPALFGLIPVFASDKSDAAYLLALEKANLSEIDTTSITTIKPSLDFKAPVLITLSEDNRLVHLSLSLEGLPIAAGYGCHTPINSRSSNIGLKEVYLTRGNPCTTTDQPEDPIAFMDNDGSKPGSTPQNKGAGSSSQNNQTSANTQNRSGQQHMGKSGSADNNGRPPRKPNNQKIKKSHYHELDDIDVIESLKQFLLFHQNFAQALRVLEKWVRRYRANSHQGFLLNLQTLVSEQAPHLPPLPLASDPSLDTVADETLEPLGSNESAINAILVSAIGYTPDSSMAYTLHWHFADNSLPISFQRNDGHPFTGTFVAPSYVSPKLKRRGNVTRQRVITDGRQQLSSPLMVIPRENNQPGRSLRLQQYANNLSASNWSLQNRGSHFERSGLRLSSRSQGVGSNLLPRGNSRQNPPLRLQQSADNLGASNRPLQSRNSHFERSGLRSSLGSQGVGSHLLPRGNSRQNPPLRLQQSADDLGASNWSLQSRSSHFERSGVRSSLRSQEGEGNQFERTRLRLSSRSQGVGSNLFFGPTAHYASEHFLPPNRRFEPAHQYRSLGSLSRLSWAGEPVTSHIPPQPRQVKQIKIPKNHYTLDWVDVWTRTLRKFFGLSRPTKQARAIQILTPRMKEQRKIVEKAQKFQPMSDVLQRAVSNSVTINSAAWILSAYFQVDTPLTSNFFSHLMVANSNTNSQNQYPFYHIPVDVNAHQLMEWTLNQFTGNFGYSIDALTVSLASVLPQGDYLDLLSNLQSALSIYDTVPENFPISLADSTHFNPPPLPPGFPLHLAEGDEGNENYESGLAAPVPVIIDNDFPPDEAPHHDEHEYGETKVGQETLL